MKRLALFPLLVAPVIACTSEPAINLGGSWMLVATFTSATITCETTAELLLSHSAGNTRFIGQRSFSTQTCTGGPEGFELQRAAGVTNAEIKGTTVTMEIDFCPHEGEVQNDNTISGTLVCPDGFPQQMTEFTGTWTATR